MPPGKDRDNAHISMPKDLKERLSKEAIRRDMTLSDVVCEDLERSLQQDTQWQLDLQHVLEGISRKLDSVLAHVERLQVRSEEPEAKPLLKRHPTEDPMQLAAWSVFKTQWDEEHVDPAFPTRMEPVSSPRKARRRWWFGGS